MKGPNPCFLLWLNKNTLRHQHLFLYLGDVWKQDNWHQWRGRCNKNIYSERRQGIITCVWLEMEQLNSAQIRVHPPVPINQTHWNELSIDFLTLPHKIDAMAEKWSKQAICSSNMVCHGSRKKKATKEELWFSFRVLLGSIYSTLSITIDSMLKDSAPGQLAIVEGKKIPTLSRYPAGKYQSVCKLKLGDAAGLPTVLRSYWTRLFNIWSRTKKFFKMNFAMSFILCFYTSVFVWAEQTII